MNFLQWKIPGKAGDLVQVHLSCPAFVRMLDPLNFEYYKKGMRFDGSGGWSDRTEIEFTLPYKGTFHIVIDLNGAPGDVRATVDISRS